MSDDPYQCTPREIYMLEYITQNHAADLRRVFQKVALFNELVRLEMIDAATVGLPLTNTGEQG